MVIYNHKEDIEMKIRMLKHCQHCGKLQFMTFNRLKSVDPFGNLKAIVYTTKCKSCKHFVILYEEVQ